MQYSIITYATMDTERDVFYVYEIFDYRLLFVSGVRHDEGQSIVGVSVVSCGTSPSVVRVINRGRQARVSSESF
jgi:hypothetical protein